MSSLLMYNHHCATLGFLVLPSEHPWWPIIDALLYYAYDSTANLSLGPTALIFISKERRFYTYLHGV